MFAGIEELTKANGGFIYWRGIEVEHYSFTGDDGEVKEQAAAEDLAARCRHLEALNVPVRGSTAIWHWGWFKDMEPGDPLRHLLAQCPGLYQERITADLSAAKRAASVPMPDWDETKAPTGRIGWTIGRNFWIWDPVRRDSYISRFQENEDESFYHVLRAAGWDIADCGQAPHLGTCYATLEGVRAFLAAHGYPGKE
jgi:hypothetical protein